MFSRSDLVATAILFLYYILASGSIALVSRLFPVPKELMRKGYHITACLSVLILLRLFDTWQSALLSVLSLLAIALLLVIVTQSLKVFRPLLIQRTSKTTEVPRQILLFALSLLILIGILWGVLGESYRFHAAVGFMAWGFGDAAAAIIGKRFGKIRYRFPPFDLNKTLEGTGAMVGAAFVSIFLTLLILTELPLLVNLISAAVLSLLSGGLEAVSRKGVDTVTIPVLTSALSIPVVAITTRLLSPLL